MTDMNISNDVLNFVEEKKIPSTLNTLTILTFIGCGLMFLFSLATPALMNFSLKMMDKAAADPDNFSAKQLADMEKSRPAMEMMVQNMTSLMIIWIAGVALCFLGALWMRKLKKDGFWLYVAGQALPIIGGLIILGKNQFIDWKSYAGLIVPIVFTFLYNAQRKYLTK